MPAEPAELFLLADAITVAGTRASASIAVAGVVLETFVVRPLLVPALLSLLGARTGWPGTRLGRAERDAHRPRADTDSSPREARPRRG